MSFKFKTFLKQKVIYNIASPILSKIKIFKNKHKGETCYLFGDGASIKYFDLSSFSDKISLSLCYMPFHKDFKYLNCQYAFQTFPYFFYPKPTTVYTTNGLQKIYRKFINQNSHINFFVNLSNYPVLWNSNIFYLFNKIQDDESAFLRDVYLNNINIFKGVFCYSISLAIFMGFKEIILLGCDYTNKITLHKHWYEKGGGKVDIMPDFEKEFLSIATKYAKITTINLRGESFNLPSKTYSDYTGKEPKYRENVDLVDISTLNEFAKCSNFRIF